MYSSIEWMGYCHRCGRFASVGDGAMRTRSRVVTAPAIYCEQCGDSIELTVSIARRPHAVFSAN